MTDEEKKEMEEQLEDLLEQGTGGIMQAYIRGKEDGYNKGLNDAWECAREIERRQANAEGNIVDCRLDAHDTFMEYSATECIFRIKKHNERIQAESEIKVGDEVRYKGYDDKMVILRITKDLNFGGSSFDAIYTDGNGLCAGGTLELVEKTGRHFEKLNELFKEIQGGDTE